MKKPRSAMLARGRRHGVRGLLAALAPDRSRKLFVPLVAYCDESGISGTQWCVIAGAIGGERAWVDFSDRWEDALGDLRVFHSREFFSRKPDGGLVPPYDSLSNREAAVLMDRLLKIFESHSLHVIGTAVDTEVFNSLDSEQRAYLTGGAYLQRVERTLEGDAVLEERVVREHWLRPGKRSAPYFLPFQYVVVQAHNYAQSAGAEHRFIFDQQKQYEPWALELWEHRQSLDRLGYQTKAPVFESKERFPGLQMADLVAYIVRRKLEGTTRHRELAVYERLQYRAHEVGLADQGVIDQLVASLPSFQTNEPEPPSGRSPSGAQS